MNSNLDGFFTFFSLYVQALLSTIFHPPDWSWYGPRSDTCCHQHGAFSPHPPRHRPRHPRAFSEPARGQRGLAGIGYGRHLSFHFAGPANDQCRGVDAWSSGRLSVSADWAEQAHPIPARARAARITRVGRHRPSTGQCGATPAWQLHPTAWHRLRG